MQLQHQDIAEAALVSREAARALLQEMQQQADDLVEIWPLRRSVVFLSRPQDSVSFCLDAFLLHRASSVHMVPCLLSSSLPPLDLLETDGLQTPEATAGEILWLPLWCAEVLSRQRLIRVMLPPFLHAGARDRGVCLDGERGREGGCVFMFLCGAARPEACDDEGEEGEGDGGEIGGNNQVKGYLRQEERHKQGLEPLPVFFFETARLLLFNPLVQPLGTEARWQKEKGLVLQLWDRRQAKIAATLSAANLEDKLVRMDHIQPSETYML
ncbi:gins complex [Cyclospora cayetanensis]|uniref:Gins complex n=1 Tax=Cyclospora cayetanensis TaxID=88456 RepID=A0A1D3CWB7_9EIME|nr:gins complex [Cyclospora cayetanensis]